MGLHVLLLLAPQSRAAAPVAGLANLAARSLTFSQHQLSNFMINVSNVGLDAATEEVAVRAEQKTLFVGGQQDAVCLQL